MCLGGSNLLLSPSIYFFCAGFIIHVHSTEVQNNTNNDCNNHIVLLFFYHDNSQNIFMAHSCHQHTQSLTRAICRTDTRQKSILFIQAPNFNPISIGGVWDTAPLILWLCFFTALQRQGATNYFKPFPQFIQYLAFFLFTVLHLVHVFKCFIFAPHLGQNASLSSTNTWHFGHRGTGWLSELVGIIAPHSAQYKFLSRKNGSMNTNTKGIKNIIGASRIIYKIIRPTFRGSTMVSFLHLSQYARIFISFIIR